jgi:hypothetical protein
MAQFKIRNGYVFIDARLNPQPRMKIVDDSHPMFKSQAFKFESTAIDPVEAEKIAKQDDEKDLHKVDDLGNKTRKELLSMYRSVFGHKAPDGHPVSKLRADIQRALDGEIATDPEDGDSPAGGESSGEGSGDGGSPEGAEDGDSPEGDDDADGIAADAPAALAGHVKPTRKK